MDDGGNNSIQTDDSTASEASQPSEPVKDSTLQPGSGQDSAELADASEGGAIPEEPESQGVGLETESAEVPPVPQEQPDAGSEPARATPAPEVSEEQAPTPQAVIPSEAVTPPSEATNQSFIKNLLAKAGEKIQFNKRKKLEKIMGLARQKGKINNADVCKALRVSDATAFRYLDLLEKQGRIKQLGKTGRDVFYQPAE